MCNVVLKSSNALEKKVPYIYIFSYYYFIRVLIISSSLSSSSFDALPWVQYPLVSTEIWIITFPEIIIIVLLNRKFNFPLSVENL